MVLETQVFVWEGEAMPGRLLRNNGLTVEILLILVMPGLLLSGCQRSIHETPSATDAATTETGSILKPTQNSRTEVYPYPLPPPPYPLPLPPTVYSTSVFTPNSIYPTISYTPFPPAITELRPTITPTVATPIPGVEPDPIQKITLSGALPAQGKP